MNELTKQARAFLKDKGAPEAQKALRPGATISWKGADGKINGPATVEGMFRVESEKWVWLTFSGQELLINANIVVKVHAVPA